MKRYISLLYLKMFDKIAQIFNYNRIKTSHFFLSIFPGELTLLKPDKGDLMQ